MGKIWQDVGRGLYVCVRGLKSAHGQTRARITVAHAKGPDSVQIISIDDIRI